MHENRVFSHAGSNFASDFPSRQACQNAVNHVLNSKFICFVELIKFYAFLPKITVLSETISREMFYFIG